MKSIEIHVRFIREALWKSSPHGRAAVLVGAGFSRNAVAISAGAPKFALWTDLLSMMEQRLGYDANSGRGTSDALRLATEFESTFGPAELESLIRSAVPDDHYEPGALHDLLLELPWADVLTTNYDTLLERARIRVPERKYDCVLTREDLPISSRPRIVKLHGSFQSYRPFISTEEHYRSYPKQFAPFVNLVQQVAMENVLCLLGFSGDDPNFLQWIGWVRDNLGENSPNIYLCGVLDLTPAREHLLRARNIIPLDLAPLVSTIPDRSVRQTKAAEWFLRSLKAGEPPDRKTWPVSRMPQTPPSVAGLPPLVPPDDTAVRPVQLKGNLQPRGWKDPPSREEVLQLVQYWRAVRTSYPGWIVCPEPNRTNFALSTSEWLDGARLDQLLTRVRDFTVAEQLVVIWELCRQLQLCVVPLFQPVPNFAADLLRRLNPYPDQLDLGHEAIRTIGEVPLGTDWPWRSGSDRTSWEDVARCWVEIAFEIATEARETFQWKRFSEWIGLLAPLRMFRPEWMARWHYERNARELFLLDVDEVRRRLSEWPIVSLPYWDAKREAIRGEVDDAGAAAKAVGSLLERARSRMQPGSPVSALSEEAWLIRLSQVLLGHSWHMDRTSKPSRSRIDFLATMRCDPFEDLEERSKATTNVSKLERTTTEVGFDVGEVRRVRHWRSHDGKEWPLLRTFEQGLLPLRSQESTLFVDGVINAARAIAATEFPYAVSLVLRLGRADGITKWFSRAHMVALTDNQVDALFEWLVPALRKAVQATLKGSDAFAGRIVSVVPEALSRIAFRLQPAKRQEVFDLAVEIYTTTVSRTDTNGEPTRVLFKRLLRSADAHEVQRWVLPLVELPLPPDGAGGWQGWPEPTNFLNSDLELPSELVKSARFRDAIGQLLHVARTGAGRNRSHAVQRLAYLFLAKAIEDQDARALGEAIWAKTGRLGLPDVDLSRTLLVRLPAPEGVQASERLKAALLAADLPTPWEDMDGQEVLQMNSVGGVLEVLRVLSNSSRRLFSSSDSHRIAWNASEATTLVKRFAEWWANNRPIAHGRRESNEEFEDIARRMASFVAISLSGVVDEQGCKDVGQLMRSLQQDTGVLALAIPALLVTGNLEEESGEKMLLQALHDVENDVYSDAVVASYVWIGFEQQKLLPRVPPSILDELLINLLGGSRPARLQQTLLYVGAIVSEFPALIDERRLNLIARALGFIERDTRIPEGLAQVEGLDDAEQRPAVRLQAAELAHEVLRMCRIKGDPVPAEVEAWQQVAASDRLPEVRQVWRSDLGAAVK